MATNNNAALREALETLVDLVEAWEDHLPSAIREKEVSPTLDKAKAALAEPMRNCDMPFVVDGPADDIADKAWRVFHHRHPDAYFDNFGLLRCIGWLLAPATDEGKVEHFDIAKFEKSLENYRTGWNDIDDPISEIRRLRGENENKDFEPETRGETK